MAEKLAFEQLFRQADAVDGNEWFVVALAPVVDRAREDLLAGAAFAEEQYGGLARRRLFRGRYRFGHSGAFADDQLVAPVDFFAEDFDFALEVFALERFSDHDFEMLGIEGLENKIVSALLHRRHRAFDGAVCGNDDDRNIDSILPQRLQHLHAIHPGHLKIQEHDRRWLTTNGGERLPPVRRHLHVAVQSAETGFQQLPRRGIVIDDQDSAAGCIHCDNSGCAVLRSDQNLRSVVHLATFWPRSEYALRPPAKKSSCLWAL